MESPQPKETPLIEPPEQEESDEQNEELVGANLMNYLLEVGKYHTCRDNKIEQIEVC